MTNSVTTSVFGAVSPPNFVPSQAALDAIDDFRAIISDGAASSFLLLATTDGGKVVRAVEGGSDSLAMIGALDLLRGAMAARLAQNV